MHVAHYTQYGAHSTVYTGQCSVKYTLLSTQYRMYKHCIVHTVQNIHYIQYTEHSTETKIQYRMPCVVHSIQCTLYSAHCSTEHMVQYIQNISRNTKLIVQLTLYITYHTVHIVLHNI